MASKTQNWSCSTRQQIPFEYQREQGRARGKWNRYPLRRPHHAFPILTATFLFIPSVIYLIEIHRHLPLRWANDRRKAQEKGMTVEQFREREWKVIEGSHFPVRGSLLGTTGAGVPEA